MYLSTFTLYIGVSQGVWSQYLTFFDRFWELVAGEFFGGLVSSGEPPQYKVVTSLSGIHNSSLQVYILILDFVIYMYMCLSLCVVFSFDDLRAGLAFMKRRASHRSEGPITFVKSNLSSTLDCLESLDGMSN